jgi:hypothetical protein
MREDAISTDLSVKYSDKPAGPNSKRKKYSIEIGKDGEEQTVEMDKNELEGVIKEMIQKQLEKK